MHWRGDMVFDLSHTHTLPRASSHERGGGSWEGIAVTSKPLARERAEIAVSNFGPVAEAAFDVRPLTVFIGPSNTGKSYLASLVYSLTKHFVSQTEVAVSPWHHHPRHWLGSHRDSEPQLPFSEPTSQDELAALQAWLTIEQGDAHGSTSNAPPMPTKLVEAIRGHIARGPARDRVLERRLKKDYGIKDIGHLKSYGSLDPATIRVSRPAGIGAAQAPTVAFNAEINGESMLVSEHKFTADHEIQLPPSTLEEYHGVYSHLLRLATSSSGSEGLELVLPQAFHGLCQLARSPFGCLVHPSHYLPADRTGIMHAHHIVVPSLVQRATYEDAEHSTPTPRLSGVLADLLVALIYSMYDHAGYAPWAEQMEAEILGGRIHIERVGETGYPNFFFIPNHWTADRAIPLMNTSSMISELAPIVLYLRHAVWRNNLLIIEEPESHLHPAMQARLAVFLAKLVRSGLRILVTTHSEWLLEQFTNLVKLSTLSEADRRSIEGEFPSLADAELTADQVGVWTFEMTDERSGSRVEEYHIGDELNTLPEQFIDVKHTLYEEWRRMSEFLA